MLNIELIRNLDELEQLKPQWDQLFQASPSATPFQSPAWLIPWWRFFSNERLCTVTFREGANLIAVFPFFIRQNNSGYRELQFVGTGISDYLDGLIVAGYERAVCERLFAFLTECSDGWDGFNLEQLRANSPLLQFSGKAQRFFSQREGCLCAALPNTLEDWHNCISPNLASDIRYSWRRARAIGTLSFQCAEPSNVDQFLRYFYSLHAARWAVRGETGVLASVELEQFHLEAAAGLLVSGMLRLCMLMLDGQPVSSVYGFSHRNRFYVYLTGFDPRFSKFSFGSLAISAAVELAIRERCRKIDFLRGREPYKFRFGATENHLVAFHCAATALSEKVKKSLD